MLRIAENDHWIWMLSIRQYSDVAYIRKDMLGDRLFLALLYRDLSVCVDAAFDHELTKNS